MIPEFLKTCIETRELVIQIVARDIATRYKGSKLGITWSAINPLIMISVYTLVFSQVFKARWDTLGDAESTVNYGLNLFCGLLVFNIFSECITRSPLLISSNPNYVKKVIFPLHILGIMAVGSATINAAISATILLAIKTMFDGTIYVEVTTLPVIWLPMLFTCLGLAWILSTVGVFIKDITQLTNSVVSMMMFLSPIFYPIEALPIKIRWIGNINPIANTIESTRSIIMHGDLPNMSHWLLYLLASIAWCEFSFKILKSNKRKFGDFL